MRSDLTRLSIDVSKDLYKLIKYSATFSDQSIKDFVIDAIKEKLNTQPDAQWTALNELTLSTLQKADKGEELETHESVDAFFDGLKKEE